MSKPKLYYFAVRGRAEIVRLVFAATNSDFEDIRYSREQWPEHKKDAPTGQMPYVDSGDKEMGLMSQSGAIARYYAKKGGLMGANDRELYLIERLLGQVEDVFQEIIKIWLAPEDKKAELLTAFTNEKGHQLLTCVKNFLEENGGQFFAGKSVSLADLACITMTDNLHDFCKDLVAKFPELDAHKQRVMDANPGVANWIKTRPETPH